MIADAIRSMVGAMGEKTRFTRDHPCPICGGCEDDPRGASQRCWGFISGKWAHCTREEFASGCTFHAGSETYSHRLYGQCLCGTEHNPLEPASSKPTIDHVYRYRNAGGVVRV